eukprot:352461-Rhodomonas_salina.8
MRSHARKEGKKDIEVRRQIRSNAPDDRAVMIERSLMRECVRAGEQKEGDAEKLYAWFKDLLPEEGKD